MTKKTDQADGRGQQPRPHEIALTGEMQLRTESGEIHPDLLPWIDALAKRMVEDWVSDDLKRSDLGDEK